jgi:hypothetical protein
VYPQAPELAADQRTLFLLEADLAARRCGPLPQAALRTLQARCALKAALQAANGPATVGRLSALSVFL